MTKINFVASKNILTISLLGFVLFILYFVHPPSSWASEQLVVTKQDDLQHIINTAPHSSEILVMEGSYAGPIVINNSISLFAENDKKVQIVNDTDEPAITINASNVTVSGFIINDEKIKAKPTIQVLADRATLNMLQIRTGSDGIAAQNANDSVVQHSKIEWSDDSVIRANRGNGIDLFDSHRWVITNTQISKMHDGIYLEQSNYTIISDCLIEHSRYGFHFMYASNSELHQNIGKKNVTGAMIMASENITVKQNSFTEQIENLNSQGILFYDTHISKIEENIVDGNRVGLYIEESNQNEFINNQISNNFIGFQWINSSQNTVTSNTLVGNVSPVQNRGASENNIYSNYWDSFNGIDINGDKLSDIAYSINPFFFDVIQKKPSFQLFFQSPGMLFLEDLYATDRATWLTDTNPKMVPTFIDQSKRNVDNPLDTLIISIILLIFSTLIIYKSRRVLK